MKTGTIIVLAGTATVVGLVLLYFYYKSRATVARGVEYNLENADIWGLTNAPAPPPTGGTASTLDAPRYAVDSRVEPAASLVAQTMESFLISANTMNRIKERIGYNTYLYRGISATHVQRFKNAFRARFDINPDSMLSYPTWTPNQSPQLYAVLEARINAPSVQTMRGSQLLAYARVEPWELNFDSYGFVPTVSADYLALKMFYTNCKQAIDGLMDAVRTEAVQYLRSKGWRFTDYGDINLTPQNA
jgi:hypothetical protein